MKHIKQFENKTFTKQDIIDYNNKRSELEKHIAKFVKLEEQTNYTNDTEFDEFSILVGFDIQDKDLLIEFVTDENEYNQIYVNKELFFKYSENPELYEKTKKYNL